VIGAINARATGDGRTASRRTRTARLNAMTVDVEDYFQVQALERSIPRASWEQIPRRVEANVDWLLNLFAANDITATFFILGWIAERHPEMVRRIAAEGHELASHGYDHMRVDRLEPTTFRKDAKRSKEILEDISGRNVIGYRAPTFSLGQHTPWAHRILEEEEYRYSSSIYPIRHDLYGTSNAPRQPFQPASCSLWELPLSTRRMFGRNLPCAGGGYFRLLPYWLSRSNLEHVNHSDHLPCIFYTHPWEIDATQPKITGIGVRNRVRHYTNLRMMPRRLEQLVRDFSWSKVVDVFADWLYPTSSLEQPTLGK